MAARIDPAIEEFLSTIKSRDGRIKKLEADRLTYAESRLVMCALGYVERLVHDKALAAKLPNGAALVDVQRLFSLCERLKLLITRTSSLVASVPYYIAVDETDPIAAVLGGTAD